jgi:hypothetical protein
MASPSRPQTPLNLQGPMSEEEQRAWHRGANSDASLRTYNRDPDLGPLPLRGRGAPRGGDRGGRGGGRGFERHRSVNEDEEREMGDRGRGRGKVT